MCDEVSLRVCAVIFVLSTQCLAYLIALHMLLERKVTACFVNFWGQSRRDLS